LSEALPEWLKVLHCPVCGKLSLEFIEAHSEIPFFGKMIMASWKCSNCGYRHTDVFSLEFREPLRYILKVKGPEDLYAKVIRSSSGTIRIPELGATIEPGPIAQGFITNVEGVLERIKDATKSFLVLSDSEHEKRKCIDVLNKLKLASQGKLPFTLILEDPLGISMITPSYDGQEIIIEKLSDEDLKRLKFGSSIILQLSKKLQEP